MNIPELVRVPLSSLRLDDTEGYLKDYITKLEDILHRVPEEFRGLVEISYDTYQEAYDDVYQTDIDFCYYRPETKEELSVREATDKVKSETERLKKMAEYEKLKKELGL